MEKLFNSYSEIGLHFIYIVWTRGEVSTALKGVLGP
jgi:hypothetical protein